MIKVTARKYCALHYRAIFLIAPPVEMLQPYKISIHVVVPHH